jgi:hypothetical protein
MMKMMTAWSGGTTFLWTQDYGTLRGTRRVTEAVRDVVFAGGLVVLAWGTVFFFGG